MLNLFINSFTIPGREQILLKHPDLAGKLCDEGKLTSESKNEQKCAGLDKMSKDEKQTLRNLNNLWVQIGFCLLGIRSFQLLIILLIPNFSNHIFSRYKEKFQFPFVICARENRVPAILVGIEERLKNTRESELLTSIEEVKKICRLRICDLVWRDPWYLNQ